MYKLFYFTDRDGHYVIQILGLIQLSFRHKSNFKCTKALEYGISKEKRTPQLIVSMTSFPQRIQYSVLAINTILQQTIKPDRIILWLAYSEFTNKEKDLPDELLRLKDLGLEIKWCEDIKSYKKLIPALREFPNDIIVTADDDLYYEKDWLEKLYKAYLRNPKYIYVHRVCRLIYKNGLVSRYTQREAMFMDFPKPSYLNSILGCSGCLFPPNSLSNEVFNIENSKKTVDLNDDFWFWGMAVLNGTKICEVSGSKSDFKIIDNSENSSLRKIQTNDDVIEKYHKLIEAYPTIKENLEDECNVELKNKISVVIPVYNVKKYLRECLDSVINQTYKKLEIIIIDDGSPDNCGKIIDEYAEKDDRIIAIHNQNQGYAKTVNDGIKMASGEYISIIESDDFIEPEMFEKLLSLITTNDCDIVKCNYYNYWTKGNINKVSRTPFGKITNKVTNLKESPELVKAHPSIWAALYKKDLLVDNNIFFTEGKDGAFLDVLFTYKALINAKKIYVTDIPYLHYRQDNVTSTVNNPKKIYCICNEFDLLTEYLKNHLEIKQYINKYKLIKQYRIYKWNLQRVAKEYKKKVLQRFRNTFIQLEQEEYVLQILPASIVSEIMLLIDEPKKYLKKYGKPKTKVTNKFVDISITQGSLSVIIMGYQIIKKEKRHAN